MRLLLQLVDGVVSYLWFVCVFICYVSCCLLVAYLCACLLVASCLLFIFCCLMFVASRLLLVFVLLFVVCCLVLDVRFFVCEFARFFLL